MSRPRPGNTAQNGDGRASPASPSLPARKQVAARASRSLPRADYFPHELASPADQGG